MLHEFLTANRHDLIERCRTKVALRRVPAASDEELLYGIPTFLDQLIRTLEIEQLPDPAKSNKVSGPSGGGPQNQSEIGAAASRHGRELLEQGFTVEQVVHDYGDLCQAVTDLAYERKAPIETDEFRTLNRCLDNAIADAVTEFNYQRSTAAELSHSKELNIRLGFFAHELRNQLNTATLALAAIKMGSVGLGGATGAILDRSLVALRNLIDKSLTEVRISTGHVAEHRLFSLAEFIAEIRMSASLEAAVHRSSLNVSAVDPRLALDADRDLLLAAVGNLLQNAFKYTHPGTTVTLSAYAASDRILIDVEDCCGGLVDGAAESMFQPFTQVNADRSGLGLGLSIARQSVQAIGGTLRVRNVPGVGCVFTVDLPRHLLAPPIFLREELVPH